APPGRRRGRSGRGGRAAPRHPRRVGQAAAAVRRAGRRRGRGPRDHPDSAQPRKSVHQTDRQRAAGVAVYFIWNAAEKDLRRHLRDPIAFLVWLGIPLMIGGILSLVLGGSDRPPTVHVLVADEDGGVFS